MLVILVHNIVKKKGIEINDNYLRLMLEVCSYMTETFEPFKTLVSAEEKSDVQIDPTLELNIEYPTEKCLVNTSKVRLIVEIIQIFAQLKKILLELQTRLR